MRRFAAQAGEILFGNAGGRSLLGHRDRFGARQPGRTHHDGPASVLCHGAGRPVPCFGRRGQRRVRHTRRAIALQALLASLLAALGGFAQIVAYFIFVTVFFIALTVASVFVGRNGTESLPADSRIPGDSPDLSLAGVAFAGSGGGSQPETVASRSAGGCTRHSRLLFSKRTKNMTWIRTIPTSEADEKLLRALEAQRELYPAEYAEPVHPTGDGTSGIVASHSLIPDALYHAFATFGALMSPELALDRRQHEMIATMVSVTNRCVY